MNYNVVSANEFLYPDRSIYESGAIAARISSARNGYAQFQVLLSDMESCEKTEAEITVTDFPGGIPEIYEGIAIPVEENINMPFTGIPHFPERKAPYYVYDCLKPFYGSLTPFKNDDGTFTAALYICIKVKSEALPGMYEGNVTVKVYGQKLNIPYTVTVYRALLPDDTDMKIIMGVSAAPITDFHKLTRGTPEAKAMMDKYYAMLRRMYQNTLYTGGVKTTKDGDGWHFDFTDFTRQVEAMLAHGFTHFLAPSIGGRRSWNESTIIVGPGLESMSYEAYVYLSQYLPAFRKLLAEKGWTDKFYQGIADEPNAANATEYRALCGLVRRFFPEIKLIDAVSYGNLHGALDVWVPLNAEYDRHMKEFETFRSNGEELWFYVCCGPRETGYINRFTDYALLSTRYLYWGSYKYNLTGYLHWAANIYQPGQNPYKQSCPEHHNSDAVCFLPAGDTHIMYPGDGEPYMSIRLEAQRMSVEDRELLKAAAKKDKAYADALCEKVFRSFKDVEYDVKAFDSLREELLKAAD